MDKLKGVLIQNNNHLQTEQTVLNALYKKLESRKFEFNENIELPYIIQYLEDFNVNKNESFCYSKKSGRTGMNTGYLIDNLDLRSKKSSIVLLDKETYDVLGVLSFDYVEWSDVDHEYDNSLYIDSFCTNQQLAIRGIGQIMITSIVDATTDLKRIDNIFLQAATKDSEGFYEKFNFRSTGKIEDKMREYKYPIDMSIVPEPEPEPVPEPVPVPVPVPAPAKVKYIKIWSRGSTLRPSRDKTQQLNKIYGEDFDFHGGKRTKNNRKRTKNNRKRTNRTYRTKRTYRKRTYRTKNNRKRT